MGDARLVLLDVDGNVGAVTSAAGTGLLQVLWDGVWTSVVGGPDVHLYPYWHLAKVACRQLGFPHARGFVERVDVDFTRLPSWTVLGFLACNGSESRLLDCDRDTISSPVPYDWGVQDSRAGAVIQCVAGRCASCTQVRVSLPLLAGGVRDQGQRGRVCLHARKEANQAGK